jgi:hypothetical protein
LSNTGVAVCVVYINNVYVRRVGEGVYAISTKLTGYPFGEVDAKYISKIPAINEINTDPEFEPYTCQVLLNDTVIYSRPEVSSKKLLVVERNRLFTVVGEKNDWAHLKIGGWIPLENIYKL